MHMLKRLGVALAALMATLSGLAVAVAVFVLLVYDWNDLRGPLARAASWTLDREVTITGDLEVDLGSLSHIRIEGLRIANIPESDEPYLLELGALDLSLRTWPIGPLLRGRFELPEVRLIAPRLVLERNRAGAPNWNLGAAPGTPKGRQEFPIIGHLTVERGALRWREPQRDMDVTASLRTAEARGGNGADPVVLSGEGTLLDQPLTLALHAGSFEALRATDRPYPVRLETAVGATRARIEGTLAEPVLLQGVDLAVAVSGPDLAAVLGPFGFPVPRTPAYGLSGRLTRRGTAWALDGLKGRLGDSDVAGDVALDLGPERPLVRADLTSLRLAADDFAGLTGAAPKGGKDYPRKAPGRMLPAQPINLDRLRATDMILDITARKIEAPYLPLDNLKAHAELKAGRLTIEPLSLGMAGGTVAGGLTLDGQRDQPAVRTDLRLQRLELKRFFQGTPFARDMGGTLGGRIELSGHGASTADLLATSNGHLALAAAGGRISNLLVKGLETDILETLGIVLTGSAPIAFNCIVGDFGAERGVLTARALVIDTDDALITGRAAVNLGRETLDLTLSGDPKSLNLFSTNLPVHVTGTFRKPEIAVESAETVARSGAAIALGLLLSPFAALLPFIEPGTNEDAPCARLVRQTQQPGPRRAR